MALFPTKALYTCLKWSLSVDMVLKDGATPLFKAAHKGHMEVVQELLKRKSNLGLLQVRIQSNQ